MVERLGEIATDLSQRFGRPPTRFALGKQMGVPHRDRRLTGEGLDHFSLFERGKRTGGQVDTQDTE